MTFAPRGFMQTAPTAMITVCLGMLVAACQSTDTSGGETVQAPAAPALPPPGGGPSGQDADGSPPPGSPGAPLDVHGRILEPGGGAVAGAIVKVGDKVVTTGADGTFQIAAVPRPYDVTFYQKRPSGDIVRSYVGLTRPDPVLDGESFVPSSDKTVAVNVTTTNCNWAWVVIIARTSEGESYVTTSPCSDASPLSTLPIPISSDHALVTFRALQWSGPVAQYVEAAANLDVGQTTAVALPLVAVPSTSTVKVTADLPTGFTSAAWQPVARFEGGITVGLSYQSFGAEVVVPHYPTATMSISAFTRDNQFRPISTATAPLDTNVSVRLPTPPRVSGSFKLNDTFQWEVGGLSVTQLSIHDRTGRPTPLDVRVTTAGASAKLPDLTPFGVAPLTDAEQPVWSVRQVGPMKSVDDYAAGNPPSVTGSTAETPTAAP